MDRFVLKHSGVRIWITGENLIPDFNILDYAIGFNDIHFGDRYLRWPLYRWGRSISECEGLRREAIESHPAHHRKRLCACVISNLTDRQGPLVEVCDAMERYQGMTYGGKWRNNIGGRVKDKLALLQEHKFSLAFENTAYPGYTTEKIVNESPECYEAMLREPIFSTVAGEALREERLVAFLENIFSQPLEQAYRRNRSRWGIKYEGLLKRMYFNPLSHLARLPKIWAVHWKGNHND
jgi:hypothetical protein